ncbi:MAG: hypothetical protein LBQ37_04780 [Elusimicrobiota bacterium]|nr:hypothetical protein [Elusimicrobiota bacterium]
MLVKKIIERSIKKSEKIFIVKGDKYGQDRTGQDRTGQDRTGSLTSRILEKILYVKNDDIYKVICILGLKIKIKIKRLELREQISRIIEKEKQLFIRIEELKFAEIFNSSIVQSQWLKETAFSPNKGSANYSFLYTLFKILDEIKPKNILEFGMGQTTKMTTQYASFYKAFLDVVDDSELWINVYKEKLFLSPKIKIHCLPLIDFNYNNTINTKYDKLNDIVKDNKYDLIIVDGPVGGGQKYPRSNILDLIPQNLAKDFIIIIDDAERQGERNIAELVLSKMQDNQIKYVNVIEGAMKYQMIICSPSYSFVTAL